LDVEELLRLGGMSDLCAFAEWYDFELDRALETTSGHREPHWTESIAVGSEGFVRRIAALSKNRKKFEIKQWADAAWYVRDPAACYPSTADCAAGLPRGTGQALEAKKGLEFWR
jgi:hypothetical protein